MFRLKIHSKFFSDVLSVGLTQVFVYFLLALLLRVLANWLGSEEMGAYLVTRRFIEVLGTVTLLSLDVSLVRYVAMHPTKAQSYLGWGVLLTKLIGLALVLLAWFNNEAVTYWILSDPALQSLVLPSILFLTGFFNFAILYAYLRGGQRMILANSLQLVYYAILLVIAIGLSWLTPGVMDMLIVYLALSGLVTLVILDIYLLREGFRFQFDRQQLTELMRFGLPRLPSGFLLSATFSIPLFVAAWQGNLEAAVLVGIGLTLIKLLEPVVMPVSLMLLPKIAELIAQGDHERLRKDGVNVISVALYVATFVSLTTPGLSSEIIHIWFGEKYLIAVPVTQIILLGVGPYLAYVILRGMLYAITVWPIVTILTALSAAVVALISYFAYDEILLAYGLMLGLFFLGGGAIIASMYLLKAVPGRETWLGLGLSLSIIVLVFWIDRTTISLPLWFSLLIKLSSRTILATATAVCLWYLQIPWFVEMTRRLPFVDQLLYKPTI